MGKNKIIGLVILAIVIVGLIFGIWYYTRPLPPKPKAEKELERFVIGLDKDIDGFYPISKAEVVSESVNWEIFSSLSKFTREGKLVADLADYWVNPDEFTWEIYLKKGVKFHDGKEMTAEDVFFSLVNVPEEIEKKTGEFYKRESVAAIDKVEIINPYAIRIKTKKPYPLLMHDLAAIGILSKDYIEKEGYEANPIGTGPYKFISWEKGKEIVLERFEDYYGKKPIAKKVIYKIIPEEEKRIEALTKGELDFATQMTLAGLEKIEKAPGIKPAVTQSIGITFLAIDQREKTPGIKLEKSPLSDQRVRKAIAYAIDKEKIVKEVFKGRATIVNQVAVPIAFGYNPDVKGYPYDPKKAKELLAEAGYPDGFEVELLSPDDERARVSEMIGKQLSEVGIKTNVKVLPRGEFFQKLFNEEASLFPLTILDTSLDVAGLATGIFHSVTEEYGSLNLVHYSNPRVDELIEKAMGTLDPKARKEYAQEIMRITAEEDLPYIPLYIGEFLGGVRKDLDFSQRPDGSINLEDLSFAK
jgi:peptide/nickel transport system substrate-binding protein